MFFKAMNQIVFLQLFASFCRDCAGFVGVGGASLDVSRYAHERTHNAR